MSASLPLKTLHRYELATQHEWLETNGLGGYASSTIIGTNTRRYHGLLVAAVNPPVERMVLVAKLEPSIITLNNRYELSTNKYRGAVYPSGYIFLQDFQRDMFPVSTFEAGGIRLRQTIVALHGENTTLVLYEVLEANESFELELNPLLAGRNYHSLAYAGQMADPQAHFSDESLHLWEESSMPNCHISLPGGSYESAPNWYYQFEYQMESYRGMQDHEDLFSPGLLKVPLSAGSRVGLILSTEPTAGRDAWELMEQERNRRIQLQNQAKAYTPVLQQLSLAADQFIVQRGSQQQTIIAGYPWFTDWGRDSMIALPGLCLATGREADAKSILQVFAEHVDHGLLPNRFPDEGETPEYNTMDATLWFFVAAWKYYQHTKDFDFIQQELLPVFAHILQAHDEGTLFNICVAEDGLLQGGQDGVQLTWMDAKVDDWVVTPRQGKAVEINALWYNAWRIYASFLDLKGEKTEAKNIEERAAQIRTRFQTVFWEEGANSLHDCVLGDEIDRSIRPNQLFAISLPFPLLNVEQAGHILTTVEQHLLTPRGLRSLSAADPRFKGHYGGDVYERDGAYHQGTVWGWLIGPYLDALIYVRGKWGKERARLVLSEFLEHLDEGCIGSLSEIFDGAAPFTPRGCYAQAWSISEVLRTHHAYQLLTPAKRTTSIKPKLNLFDRMVAAGFL